MKILLIAFSIVLFIWAPSYSQGSNNDTVSQSSNIDTIRLQRLDADIYHFIKELGVFISTTDTIENATDINLTARDLNNASIIILDSINRVFNLNNSDDELDAGMYYGLSAAFSQSYPILSALYLSLASNTVINGKQVNQFYNNLKDVRDISFKMSKSKKIEKLKKLHLHLIDSYNKLNKI